MGVRPGAVKFRCVRCDGVVPEGRFRCRCGALGEIRPDLQSMDGDSLVASFQARRSARSGVDASGVWRFRELIWPKVKLHQIITKREGNTRVYRPPRIVDYLGVGKLSIKHEGENPTGSYADRGLTVAVTRAIVEGAKGLACASTGNSGAALAAYGAVAGVPTVVFVPAGQVSAAKLSQIVSYGAQLVELEGSFRKVSAVARSVCRELGMAWLGSENPWRIEGQKSVMYELIHDLEWQAPDWVVVAGGSLDNAAAFGKALRELYDLDLIERMPKLVAVQPEGAASFVRFFEARADNPHVEFEALASPETAVEALRIGRPKSWERAIREVEFSGGRAMAVSEEAIVEAKGIVDGAGIGCEKAAALSIAGVKKLVGEGVIDEHDHVVAVLTGHFLKDGGAASSPEGRGLRLPAVADEVAGALMERLKR